jgi:hypothetical protein
MRGAKKWRTLGPCNFQVKFRTAKLATVPSCQNGVIYPFDAGQMISLRVRIHREWFKYVTESLIFENG